MMSQFMGNCIGKGQHSLSGHLLLPDINIVESDAAGILHRTPLVFVSEDLVILAECKLVTEEGLEEFHGLNCNLKHEGARSSMCLYSDSMQYNDIGMF